MADGDEWENEMNSDDAGEAVSGGAGDLVPTERKRVQSHNGSDSYEPELLTAMGKNKRRRESNNDDSQEDRDRAIDKEIEQHEALMKHYLLPSPNDNQVCVILVAFLSKPNWIIAEILESDKRKNETRPNS